MQRLIARVRVFFGMDLPERTLQLKFTLPKVSGRFKASNASGEDFDSRLDEAKDAPSEYFRLLLDEIKHINRCKMKHGQRLSMMRQMLKLYYPMALAQIAKQALRGGVPEAEDRMQLLNMLVDIAQILIISYQILFVEHYGSSNFQYAKSRNTVRECASRIFELLILKQKSKGLRYQLLSEQDWQVANTIFYVMSRYEDVEQPLPTLKKELKLDCGRSEASLREQFASLQIVAKFDMLRWPTHLQWVVESYLHSVKNSVQVKADDGSGKLGRNDLIAYCYGVNPAGVNRLQAPPGPALILACNGLTAAIQKDCMGMMQAKRNNDMSAIPPRIARLPETDQFLVSDQLVRGLENTTDGACVEKEHKFDDLRIFVGFSEVFGLLRHKQGRFGSEERLADVLAKRSALIAEDHHATKKSEWSLLFRNEKMMRLSTQESNFTTPMAIGSLLAYGVGDDVNRPSLAMVSRIFRPSHKVVVIDIHSVADYAEAVMTTMNASEEKPSSLNQAKPALLVHDKKRLGEWGLIVPPQGVLLGFDKFAMHRNNKSCAINLENMRNATTDFYLFSTSLTPEELGIEGDPAYAIPSARKTYSAGSLF